jgi:thiamine kinase-like enzyme
VEGEGKYNKVRIPGKKTELYLDRDAEVVNLKALEPTGVISKVIDYKKESQITIFEYIPGRAAHKEDFRDPEIREKAVASMKKIHTSNARLCTDFDVFREIDRYLGLASGYGDYMLRDYPMERLLSTTKALKNETNRNDSSIVASHNDTLPENFIISDDNKIYIIDWEYGGMNDRCFDIANFLVEASGALTESDEEDVLKLYFGEEREGIRQRVDSYKFLSDFCWSVWALTQYHVSELDFDFDEYARFRFDRSVKYAEMLRERYSIPF